jgi:exodeoxyribonuclease V
MTLTLSADQADACEQIRRWVYERCDVWREGAASEILTLGGYAGCGKTTVLGVLAAEFETKGVLVAYATFTGRASTILAKKLGDQNVFASNRLLASSNRQLEGKYAKFFLGVGQERMPFCGTLHRLLYAPMINEETEELLGWRTRPKLDRRYGLIVVDEASMVGDKMLSDIVRHGVPILAVGDHGQLSPVLDSGSLMRAPQVRLEMIHRQAADNPIIQLSKVIREMGRIDRQLDGRSSIAYGKRADLGATYNDCMAGRVESSDILDIAALCWTNKTRISANRLIRATLGFKGAPKRNDAVMCLRNTDVISNGMRAVLTRDAEVVGWKLDTNLDFPFEEINGDFELCGYQFGREKTIGSVEEVQRLAPGVKRMSELGVLCDWGYCLTVHKAQGTTLQHVIGILDRPASPNDPEYRRWLYTLVTRASHKLTLLS